MVGNPVESKKQYYAVQCTGLIAQSPSGQMKFHFPNNTGVLYASLDSGSTGSYLPAHFMPDTNKYLGVYPGGPSTQNKPVIPCNLSTSAVIFSFYFGGPTGPKINVPLSEFIAPREPTTANWTFSDGTDAYALNIGKHDSYQMLLGDSFLRSTYAVFNLESRQIALAQSNPNSALAPKIKEITSGNWGIPGVNKIAPLYAFNRKALVAMDAKNVSKVSSKSTAPIPTSNGHITSTNPSRGSVTAVGLAGALWQGPGLPIPAPIPTAPRSVAAHGQIAEAKAPPGLVPRVVPLRKRTPSQGPTGAANARICIDTTNLFLAGFGSLLAILA